MHSPSAFAAPAVDGQVVQIFPEGTMDWTRGVLSATGKGMMDGHEKNVTTARMNAELGAKADALAKLAVLLQNLVEHDTEEGLCTLLCADEALQARVQDFRVTQTRYGVGGSVQVTLEADVNALLQKQSPISASSVSADAQALGMVIAMEMENNSTTGIVINARGLGLVPAWHLTVRDDRGGVVLGLKGTEWHPGAYWRSLDGALKDAHVGERPWVIKALRLAGARDVVIAVKDGIMLRSLLALVQQGRVVVVID